MANLYPKSKGGNMKMLLFSFLVGVFLLYFLNIAFLKNPILDLHWSIHASVRFFAGFVILGVSYFYAHAIKFKNAMYIIISIVVADYVYDYFMETNIIKIETFLHGTFMIFWGAILGYLFAKYIKERSIHS